MNCKECNLPGKFICKCQYFILCSVHQPLHMSKTGHNSIECLNISPKPLISETLRNEMLKSIIKLNQSIENIFNFSRNIIRKVQSCNNELIKNIENKVQLYLKWISLPKFSESLKKKLEKVNSSTLIIKSNNGNIGKAFENIGAFIENAFNVEIFALLNNKTEAEKLNQTDNKNTREKCEIKRTNEQIEENKRKTEVLEIKKIKKKKKK